MSRAPLRRAVALDGGTSNTRARLLVDGIVVATARRAVGVRESALAATRETLASAVRETLLELAAAAPAEKPDVIVAAGMLSSEVGLTAVPHVDAPAGLEELARGAVLRALPEVVDRPILFVPGVRTPPAAGIDGWAEADVMRGEECETLGVWSRLGDERQVPSMEPQGSRADRPPHSIFLWPGSHTKLVEVDADGRIVRSYTTLGGEMTQALARHTLLAASLPESLPESPDPEALAAGARLVARDGLGRAAFLVRLAALTGTFDAHGRASFWVGAVIVDDVAHLARHAMLQSGSPVWVGGRQPQRTVYADYLRRRAFGMVRELGEEPAATASALGALAVAMRHAEIFGQ